MKIMDSDTSSEPESFEDFLFWFDVSSELAQNTYCDCTRTVFVCRCVCLESDIKYASEVASGYSRGLVCWQVKAIGRFCSFLCVMLTLHCLNNKIIYVNDYRTRLNSFWVHILCMIILDLDGRWYDGVNANVLRGINSMQYDFKVLLGLLFAPKPNFSRRILLDAWAHIGLWVMANTVALLGSCICILCRRYSLHMHTFNLK